MAIVFNVGVSDRVTYYFRMIYSPAVKMWLPIGIVSEADAVLGGPTYGIPLSSEFEIYQPPPGVTKAGLDKIGRVSASYYNSSNDGCPGFCFIRLIFSIPENGFTSFYGVSSNNREIIRGLIQTGSASDNDPPGLPPGGDPGSCADPNDGINGGNS